MTALDRKMLRDLRRLWAQVLATALVLGCGIMVLVGADATQATLIQTQKAWYERHRFADVFAAMTRAPRSIVTEVLQIEGVVQAEGRITLDAVVDLAGMTEPATVRVLSLPGGGASLNLPMVRNGRLPDPERSGEVLVNEPFAMANDLVPGSHFQAVLNGQLRDLEVAGWVLSPEFVYTIAPGAMMPDDHHFGLIWMNEPALAVAMDMEGAINDISLRLLRNADQRAVIAALDSLLSPYGGTGAFGRDRQVSHAFLDGELHQLGVMALYLPPIFLLVAAFLVNMVLGRLIAMQRAQIGLLKALGYGQGQIAAHFLKLALLIGVTGLFLGWAFGWWLSDAMIGLYRDFFRFPFIIRDFGTRALAVSAVLGFASVTLGALRSVMATVRLPAAEAMRPPAPPLFSRGAADRLLVPLALQQTTMMILRSILRWPGRAAITAFGVAASVALLVTSYFMLDSITRLADTVFGLANRQDVTLTLRQPQTEAVLLDARNLPGVLAIEGGYGMPVRLVKENHSRLGVLRAQVQAAELARLVDDAGRVVDLPAEGLVLPGLLAKALDARIGDRIVVEMLAPPRETLALPVAMVIDQGMGQEAHVSAPFLFAAMRVAPQVNALHLSVDPDRRAELHAAIKATPAVAGLADWEDVRRQFEATLSENLAISIMIYSLIGVIIAVGVVYNAARIQLSERGNEFATLRVLGFRRAEVAFVLVGEMMLLAVLAIPFGWMAGYWLARGLVAVMSTDLIQIPFFITPRTYAYSAVVVLGAALGSTLLVRRRLDRLDLVAALKARE